MDKETGKTVVYFLCTGNSCRSQMAEGYAKFFGNAKVEVYSAGIEQHGLNPRAVLAMAEDGIDIRKQTSDLINPEILAKSDIVITLCGDANDKCPITPPDVNRQHWDLPDPAKVTGTEEEIMAVFRKVREAIKSRVGELLEQINSFH